MSAPEDRALLAEQVAYYRAIAGQYEDHEIPGAGAEEISAALEAFRPEGRVLELACGPGAWTEILLRYADTELGETSEDGLFTVMEVECLAACGFPTAIQINSQYFENVTPADVPAIVQRLRDEARARLAASPGGGR